MKLAMLGGGGFRTPLVHRALLADPGPITEIVLYDVDSERLGAIARVLAELDAAHPGGPRVSATDSLDVALEGADFVFSAIRVGGLAGRTADERVALELGLLGQETSGPGGVAYGLRTIPVALAIAERVRDLAPTAWVINFTNPAGMVTEAMQSVLGDRVVGICDSPLGLARRAADALGIPLAEAEIDYLGLNHLGWLQGLRHDGEDLLPRLLADPARLSGIEEGQLFGADWLGELRMLPNEYLYYYYFTREAVASLQAAPQTRGEYLLHQQRAFYESLRGCSAGAAVEWERVRLERNATYMREARDDGEERHADDVAGGGYEGVALAIMRSIAADVPATLILNVANRGTQPGLPDDAVIEVPCTVTAAGPRPQSVTPLQGHALGLVHQVKAVDRATIEAARTGSPTAARTAFALHPLVDSVSVAAQLLAGYRARIPSLEAVFARP